MGLIAHILKYYGYEKVQPCPEVVEVAKPVDNLQKIEQQLIQDDANGTMMPRNVVNDYFVAHKVRFEEKLKPGQQVRVKWDYIPGRMDDTMIEDIVPSCGCTADIRIGKVGISALFTHTKEKVPPGGDEYTFGLTVYFRDGHGKVKDDRGKTIWDPQKKRRTLTFGGKLLPAS